MFTFTVKPDSAEEFEVTATSRDVVRWEKTGKGRSLGRFSDNPTMTDLYSLAHGAALRQGLWAGPVAEFEQSVDVELHSDDSNDSDEDDDESGPTRRAR